jgi:hypothetical protein
LYVLAVSRKPRFVKKSIDGVSVVTTPGVK